MMIGICGNGTFLPAFIILDSKEVNGNTGSFRFPRAFGNEYGVAACEGGSMTCGKTKRTENGSYEYVEGTYDQFAKWILQNNSLRKWLDLENGQPIVHCMDQHGSHFSEQALESFLADGQRILYGHPNSTFMLQPNDDMVNRMFAKFKRDGLAEARNVSRQEFKDDLIGILIRAHQWACTRKNIRTSYRNTGWAYTSVRGDDAFKYFDLSTGSIKKFIQKLLQEGKFPVITDKDAWARSSKYDKSKAALDPLASPEAVEFLELVARSIESPKQRLTKDHAKKIVSTLQYRDESHRCLTIEMVLKQHREKLQQRKEIDDAQAARAQEKKRKQRLMQLAESILQRSWAVSKKKIDAEKLSEFINGRLQESDLIDHLTEVKENLQRRQIQVRNPNESEPNEEPSISAPPPSTRTISKKRTRDVGLSNRGVLALGPEKIITDRSNRKWLKD